MKSVVRWGAMGLFGSAIIGSSTIGAVQVLALPQEQILQKLQSVPVFMIASGDGTRLLSQCFDPGTRKEVNCNPTGSTNAASQKKVVVVPAFMSQHDAQAALEQLKQKKPQDVQTLQVVPKPLAYVYQVEQASKTKPDRLVFEYVPAQQQVQTALAILRQSGKKVQDFNGVPVFIARSTKDKGYLTIQQGNQPLIPMFFDKDQLQKMLDQFKQKHPSQASNLEIEVENLDGVLQTLQTRNDKQLNNIVFYPSQESLDFLRTLQPAATQNQSQPGTTPQAAPAPTSGGAATPQSPRP